jgi:arabinan endo-1,5-alpha-L-arabinosidase
VAQEGSELISVMSNATTPLNEWTHVAVCLDGSEATIYINGQLDASAGYGQRISCEDCQLWISSLSKSTRFYNGKIDDVRIYNIELSAEEIAVLAQ